MMVLIEQLKNLIIACNALRDLWLKGSLENSPEWHEAVLKIVQIMDKLYPRE